MTTKLNEILAIFSESVENLTKSLSKDSSSYQFESSFDSLLQEFGQSVYQQIVGRLPKSKNDRITVLTSLGNVCFPKSHPLATAW